MTPPRVAIEPTYTVGYPALQLPWVVLDPAITHTVQRIAHLTRRDFLKISAVGTLFAAFLSSCGPANSESILASETANEIPTPKPDEVPGFVAPVRPWMVDLTTGLALPATAEIGRQVGETFGRWINPFKPLVELHDQQQMVIRASNNTRVGAELGYASQSSIIDLQSERATNGFSFTESAKGEQFVRPGPGGFLPPTRTI